MAKTKTIKAKVVKIPTQAKRRSKGARYPWYVYIIDTNSGFHDFEGECKTRKEAERYVRDHPDQAELVIAHIDIPPMEY